MLSFWAWGGYPNQFALLSQSIGIIIHPIFYANLVLLAEILGIDNCSCQNKWGGFNLICTPRRPFCKTQRLGFYDHTCNLSALLKSLLHLNATFLFYSAGSQGYSFRYLCFVFEAINLKHCQSWIFFATGLPIWHKETLLDICKFLKLKPSN